MPKIKRKSPSRITSIEMLARVLGLTVPQVIAAINNPVLWELIGGGYGNRGLPVMALTEPARKELVDTLSGAISSLSKRLDEGELAAAPHILQLSLQKATLQSIQPSN